MLPSLKGNLLRFTGTALICIVGSALAVVGQVHLTGEKLEAGHPGVGTAIAGGSEVKPAGAKTESRLEFDSSDPRLVEGFNWAKKQALAYAFDGDPVGPWYEAALPGREAFCMRDTAHQAMGAHALGLARHNLNMLRRFAENISDSRDWCSLWEIDRYNRPAPVDYKNDAEFWYNLPANFDILDCCYRMYVWTGDPTYVNDPVFLNFYDHTIADYVERWDLSLDRVMKRSRLMNVRGAFDPQKKFLVARGIPGYDEGDQDYTLGVDVLATQYAAYLAYARMQEVRGNEERARTYLKKAAEVKAFVNQAWWNEREQYFYERLDADHRLEGRGAEDLLYRDVADDGPRARSALNALLDNIKREPSSGVEAQSHYAEILYRYGVPEVAYEQMMDVTRANRERREYPEVSYSVIAAIVNGAMGINLEFPSTLLAAVEMLWVETVVKTLPALGNIARAELRNLPIRANEVTVRHEGGRKTVFTNQKGPSLIWQATFAGSFGTLLVDGVPMKARTEKGVLGNMTSFVRVPVGAGGTVRVEIPE